jgi:tetratricopeptide (TPR) repeat protein
MKRSFMQCVINKSLWSGICAILVLAAACSSAPNTPAGVDRQRRLAREQLIQAGRETDRGNYEQALTMVDEAYRLAVSTDDPLLLVRTRLSRGNIFTHLGRGEEAQAAYSAALSEAEGIGDRELAAICRIYITRSRLFGALSRGDAQAAARDVLDQIQQDIQAVRTDPPAIALGWIVAGLAEKELRQWSDAESSLKKALDIHAKEQYLELAAYDWYLIASVRSVAGQYDGALTALNEALEFDRRTENTYGLGMDWMALGDVYKKAGDGAASARAYRRAAEIFRSIGLEKEAAEAEGRAELPAKLSAE